MKKTMAAVVLAVCLCLIGCTKAEQSQNANAGEASAVAAKVNGEEISLREWNFYVRMNQMQWERNYLESYGDEMWSREMDEDGTILAELLKEEVLETIYRTRLLDQHAQEYEVSLSDDALEEIRTRSQQFMNAYNEGLLEYAGADEDFVYEQLCMTELSALVAEAMVSDYDPGITEEDVHREGICYVLVSNVGLWDSEGVLTPYTEEEVEERAELAREVCRLAKESGNLKEEAEAADLIPIESSMGNSNEYDGQDPNMLDAARLLEVGEVSEPIEIEEGWFIVQHTSDYDEEGTEYWREYLTDLAKEEECARIYEEWREAADITVFQEVLDKVDVKIVLKELPLK